MSLVSQECAAYRCMKQQKILPPQRTKGSASVVPPLFRNALFVPILNALRRRKHRISDSSLCGTQQITAVTGSVYSNQSVG